MNALVRKEIRLILPAWALAMVLAILPVWLLWPGVSYGLTPQAPGVLVYAPFALGVLLLGLAPFANELNYGTFSILLAQPASRRRLWVTKTIVVGAALLIVFGTLCVSNSLRALDVVGGLRDTVWERALREFGTRVLVLRLIDSLYQEVLHNTLVYGGLCALAAFAGGLWTNLLFRNTSAALWFTMLIPLGLGMLVQGLFGAVGVIADVTLIITLVLYSAAGFLWAKKYFLRVQDTQWTGGIISFPTWFASGSGSEGEPSERKRKPLRALLRKDIHFQQANLFIACLLLFTHLLDIAVRKFGASYFLAHRQAAMIWESWPLLWLAMPFLIGAVAVAEERKLGTLESLLCLPTKRRHEFLVKFAMVVILGILLGGAVPVFIEWLGTLVGVHSNAGTLAVNWTMIPQTRALLAGSAALVVLAFYASTLTRNLLAALGLTVAWSAVAFLLTVLVAAIGDVGFDRVALWRGKLPFLMILPGMLTAVVWLSFANFKHLQSGSRVWLRNVFVLVAALLCSATLTTVTYYRVWEVWMPDEPVQGYQGMTRRSAKRFFGKANPTMESSLARIAVVLPDGSLWLKRGQVKLIERHNGQGTTYWQPLEAGPWHSGYAVGTNWNDVAVTPQHCVAIQKDGSLWDLSEITPDVRDSAAPKRVGSDSDWKSVTAGANSFAALKTNGTLWQWGGLPKFTGTNILTEEVLAPRQVGSENGWIAVSDTGSSAGGVVIRDDGSVWRYGFLAQSNVNPKRWVLEPERWLSGPAKEPRSICFDGGRLAVVYEDGSLWGAGYWPQIPSDERKAQSQLVRLGRDSDWIEVRINWRVAVGIKSDHSLWFCDFIGRRPGWNWENTSRYNKWTSISPKDDMFLALALDGSLCLWNPRAFEDRNSWYHFWSENQLLMPSRIKARETANLLE